MASLSVSAIARLERGGKPKAATVAVLERALGVPAGSLDPSAARKSAGGADGESSRKG